jgi:ketosteroid isomerase-like protein
MSGEDVGVVERWIRAFENDADAFRDILHPDIVWFPFEDNHTPSHGIESAMRVRTQWFDSWDQMRGELEQAVVGTDGVVASVHVTGRGKASGVEVDVRLHLHFKMQDGKVIYLYEHGARTTALEAAGLRE